MKNHVIQSDVQEEESKATIYRLTRDARPLIIRPLGKHAEHETSSAFRAFFEKRISRVTLPEDFTYHVLTYHKTKNARWRHVSSSILKSALYKDKRELAYFFSTPGQCSFLEIDYGNLYFTGIVNDVDPFLHYLLMKGARVAAMVSSVTRIHCAWVQQRRDASFSSGWR